MSQRKPWSQEEDRLLKRLTLDNEVKDVDKLKWGEIARELQSIGSKRTGKQCRERWHNQLRPGIENEKEWSPQQQQTLFRVQEQLGNRWAQIAKKLPGRTDNNIKNYFYSTLRKALRKVNAYVQHHKKQQKYRNVKQFKQQTLSKILTVAEKKYEHKINLKSNSAQQDARQIKRLLVRIQRDQQINGDSQMCKQLQQVIDRILQFNRNCKRRKGKKKDSQDDGQKSQSQQVYEQNSMIKEQEQEEILFVPQSMGKANSKSKKSKQQRAKKSKQVTILMEQQKKDMKIQTENNIFKTSSFSQIKKPNDAAGFRQSSVFRSSAFKQYQGGNQSQNLNNNINFDVSRGYFNTNGSNDKLQFICSIPNLQKKNTSNMFDPFPWKQQPAQNINLVDSYNYAAMYQQNNNGLLFSMGMSGAIPVVRKAQSKTQRKISEGSKNHE